MKIETICIGGGGFVGYAYYGALKYLHEHNLLNHCHTYIGTSAGAALALVFSASFSDAIKHEMLDCISSIFCENDLDLLDFHTNWGVCNKLTLMSTFNNALKKMYHENITFKELYDITQKKLVITAVNLCKQCSVHFSYETYPNLKIIDALEASINIPFVMTKKIIDNDVYCDGCLGPSVSIDAACTPKRNTLILHHYKSTESSLEVNSFENYVFSMFKFLTKTPASFYSGYPTILIDSSEIPFISDNCEFVSKHKNQFIECGYNSAQEWSSTI